MHKCTLFCQFLLSVRGGGSTEVNKRHPNVFCGMRAPKKMITYIIYHLTACNQRDRLSKENFNLDSVKHT